MKKLILLVPILLLLMGCSSEEEDVQPTTYTIVGKWKHIKVEYYENNLLVETEIAEHFPNCPNFVEFKSNNTFEAVYFDELCTSDIEESGTYIFTNNVLSTTSSGETYNLDVTTLSENELVLEEEYAEDGINIREVSIFERIE